MDSSGQIKIRIFEIHKLSVFLGKDLKKVFDKRFSEQKCYVTDAVQTEPMLIHVCYLFIFVDCF